MKPVFPAVAGILLLSFRARDYRLRSKDKAQEKTEPPVRGLRYDEINPNTRAMLFPYLIEKNLI